MTDGQLPFNISICGLHEIQRFAERGITHLLTLLGPCMDIDTPDWLLRSHSKVFFDDISWHERTARPDITPPTEDHVRRILAFGRTCHEAGRKQPTIC